MFEEATPGENLQDLKKIREEKGLSLEDLFARTRVRVAYLQAIENREFHLLPVPVYSRNFIRIYTRALGIDHEPLMREYENYLSSLNEPKPSVEVVPDKKNILQKINLKKIYLALALVLLMVFVTHWLLTRRYELPPEAVKTPEMSANMALPATPANTDQNVNPTPATNNQVKSEPSTPPNSGSVAPPAAEKKVTGSGAVSETVRAPSQPAAVPNAADKEKGLLTITATEDTWLRIKADENPPIQVFLKAGEKFQYKAKSLVMDIGNAGGIKLKFREKNLENLGKTGEVVHLRLP